MQTYGDPPVSLGHFDLNWDEYMHFMYLPVVMVESGPHDIRLPDQLKFLTPIIEKVALDAKLDHHGGYVYVTARRGFATPDNPLNRPGWHCDGFGTDDLNYVWWDRWGTRFAWQPFEDISIDHSESMRQFEEQVECWDTPPDRYLYRLTPYVVHSTPIVPEGGGLRSFLKVSVSRHRYNLIGNSHNHLFDYDWKMHPRDIARNDPAHGQTDFYESS